MENKQKLRFRDLSLPLKGLVIFGLIDAVIKITYFIWGFIEGYSALV